MACRLSNFPYGVSAASTVGFSALGRAKDYKNAMLPLSCRLLLRITVPILLLASISTAADEPRRVLQLDSFEKGFAPFEVFKATLASVSGGGKTQRQDAEFEQPAGGSL